MEICKRHYKKWTINEILQLQREHELLELSIQEIARIHSRTIRAILCKLEKENFIENWYQAKGFIDYALTQPDLREYLLDDQDSVSSGISSSNTTISTDESFYSSMENANETSKEYETSFDFISKINDNNEEKYCYIQPPSQIVKKFIDKCISFFTNSA